MVPQTPQGKKKGWGGFSIFSSDYEWPFPKFSWENTSDSDMHVVG